MKDGVRNLASRRGVGAATWAVLVSSPPVTAYEYSFSTFDASSNWLANVKTWQRTVLKAAVEQAEEGKPPTLKKRRRPSEDVEARKHATCKSQH